MQLFRADATIFSIFFAHETMKKTPSKVAHHRPIFFSTGQAAQTSPELIFHFITRLSTDLLFLRPKIDKVLIKSCDGLMDNEKALELDNRIFFFIFQPDFNKEMLTMITPNILVSTWFFVALYEISLEHFRIFSWTVFKICLRLAASRKFVKLFSNIP